MNKKGNYNLFLWVIIAVLVFIIIARMLGWL